MKTLYEDLLDSLDSDDIVGTLPISGYALTNAVDSRLSRSVRWASGSTVLIEFDLGSAQSFDALAILSHNLTNAATIQLKTGSTSLFVAPIDTISITWAERNIFQEVTLSSSARYIRFEFTDNANPDGYINVGRTIIDDVYTFPGFAPVVSRDSIDRGNSRRSDTDQVYGERRYRLQRLSVEFPRISESDREAYEDYLEGTGGGTAHVIYLDESDRCSFDFGVKTLYVTNEEITESLELNAGRFFSTRHTIREAY